MDIDGANFKEDDFFSHLKIDVSAFNISRKTNILHHQYSDNIYLVTDDKMIMIMSKNVNKDILN